MSGDKGSLGVVGDEGEVGLGLVGGLGVRIYEWSERGLELGVGGIGGLWDGVRGKGI